MKHPTMRVISDEVIGTVPEESGVSLPTMGGERHLITSISYAKGGMSYLSGKREPRGYWLTVRIEDIKDSVRSFTLFTGGRKIFIEGAAVFSHKRLAAIEPPEERIAQLQADMREQANRI